MPNLIIKKTITPADIEGLLSTPNLGEYTLILPNTIKYAGALGCSAALTQFLLTWSRASVRRCINTYLRSDRDDAYGDFTGRMHGLAAAYFSRVITPIDNRSMNIKLPLLHSARKRILAMHASELNQTSIGPAIEMIFIAEAEHAFHGSLYTRAPTVMEQADPESHGRLVRSKVDINSFVKECFLQLHMDDVLRHTFRSDDNLWGSLLSEAFRNTAEHAYLRADGSKLDLNMRCIRLSRTQVSRDWLSCFRVSSSVRNDGAKHYFQKVSSKTKKYKRENVDMAELSIFDSGLGFASTMQNSKASSGASDLDLVKDCFRENQSSKPQKTSGIGLQRILSAVKSMDGFVRVRTSSCEAFYTGMECGVDRIDPDAFVFGGMGKVEGTLITVGIPTSF